jgi:hypothetical protein
MLLTVTRLSLSHARRSSISVSVGLGSRYPQPPDVNLKDVYGFPWRPGPGGVFIPRPAGNFFTAVVYKLATKSEKNGISRPGMTHVEMTAQCLRSMQINLAREAAAAAPLSPYDPEPDCAIGTPGMVTPHIPQIDTPSCSFTAFKREREAETGAFVPVQCPLSCKVPSPVEQMVQEQRQQLLAMQLERAEYEIFKLRRQLRKMTEDNETKTSRVLLLQKNLSASRAREFSSAASVTELEGKLAVAEEARDALKAEIEILQHLLLQVDGNAELARTRGVASLLVRRNAYQKRHVLRTLEFRFVSGRALAAAGSRVRMFARRLSLEAGLSAWMNFTHDARVAKHFPLGSETAGANDGCNSKTQAAPSPCMSVSKLAMSCGLAWDNHGKLSFAPRALGAAHPPPPSNKHVASSTAATKNATGALWVGGPRSEGQGEVLYFVDLACAVVQRAATSLPQHAHAATSQTAGASAASLEDARRGALSCAGGEGLAREEPGETRKDLGVLHGGSAGGAGRHTKFQPSYCGKPMGKQPAKPAHNALKAKLFGGKAMAPRRESVKVVNVQPSTRPPCVTNQVSPLRLAEAVLKVYARVLFLYIFLFVHFLFLYIFCM